MYSPDQQVEETVDVELIVRFRAGGLREMAWHPFTWGDDVEVLDSPELRREIERGLLRALKRQGAEARIAPASRRARGAASG